MRFVARAAAVLALVVAASSAAPAEQTKPEPLAIAVAPVLGIPSESRFPFEDYLKLLATTRNMKVVPDDDPAVAYRLKARLSAVSTATVATLVYAWTVTDASGAVVLRFAGQLDAGGNVADPWLSFGVNHLYEAARDTVDTFADWVRNKAPARPLQ